MTEKIEITFVEAKGTRRLIAAEIGASLMEAAIRNGVPGILGECGGASACATCHVYLSTAWNELVDPPGNTEIGLLEMVVEPTIESRLSCQVILRPAMDGLTVRIPATQI
jgi:ferredoxin, 2Fe-2S